MKKSMYLVFLFCMMCVMIGCGSSSQKGKWAENEKSVAKEKFIEAMKKQLSERGQPVDDNVVNEIATCWVNKLEAEFANLSEANDNAAKRSELSDNCVKEILMPTNGGETQSTEGQASDSTQTAQ